MFGTKTSEENFWCAQIVDAHRSSDNNSPATVVILGEQNSVLGIESNEDTNSIQYNCIFRSDNEKCLGDSYVSVWSFTNPSLHKNLLKFALNNKTFVRSAVLLCASFFEPWNLLETLENYAKLLETHLISQKIDTSLLKTCQIRERKFWNNYGSTSKSLSPDLDQFVLTKNLGIPIVVVITRCDLISKIEKENLYAQEHFDFIQENLRWFCLKYGAALAYIDDKENCNKEILCKYVLHRLLAIPYDEFVCFTERNSIFIPAGWDSDKKIEILSENYQNIESLDDFNEHIHKPTETKNFDEGAVEFAEDDQEFLARMANLLSVQISPIYKSENHLPSRIQQSPPVQKSCENSKCTSTAAAASCTGQESVLTNFFNKLITDKSKSIVKSIKSTKEIDENRDKSIDADVEFLLNDIKNISNTNDSTSKRNSYSFVSNQKTSPNVKN